MFLVIKLIAEAKLKEGGAICSWNSLGHDEVKG